MTKRNSLMEWLDQTRKLSKSTDYVCLHTIDSVLDALWYIDHRILEKHRDIIDDICKRYHKTNTNPLLLNSGRKKAEKLYERKNGIPLQKRVSAQLKKQFKGKPIHCFGTKDWRSCELSKFGIASLSKYVDSSLTRCEMIQKDALWAWHEVIDFMWERPELINPNVIDEYVKERIYFVCEVYRKDNPLANGIHKKFGKEWRDDKGVWHKERRHRF